MTDSAVKDAFQRMSYALTCDEKGHYQEAYRNYIATTTYISNVLGLRSSSEVWCDDKSQKLLELAKMCIEAALKINGMALENNSAPQERLPAAHSTDSIIPRPVSPQVSATTPPQPPPSGTVDLGVGDIDIFSILDALPDVPANKPGHKYKEPMKRSATLPVLPKPPLNNTITPPPAARGPLNDTIKPPPAARAPSKTLPRNMDPPKPSNIPTRSRSVYIPPSNQQQNSHFSSPLGGTLKQVSPLERAKQQNAVLAARYERRAQRGMLRPRDRLQLSRAQEENMMIARELEKILAKKSEQRKERLHQEELEQDHTVERDMGTYEAILYGKKEHLIKLVSSARDYDLQFRSRPASEDKMENVLAWCFGESSHPINKTVGEAQFNFYNRLVPLNKKLFMASKEERVSLYPGIEAELKAITADISEFLSVLTMVLCNLYPMFACNEGTKMQLQTGLSEFFFKPFLQLLLETYNFLKEDDVAVLTKYFADHSQDDIKSHPDIKQKYHLGEAPYNSAIQALQAFTETTSPIKKRSLLVSFGQLICSSVRQFYLESGASEEEASEVSSMGADDMMPISIYIITRSGLPQLLTELLLLTELTPEDEMMGSEGYCLITVQHAIEYIIRRERELLVLQKSGENDGNVGENSGTS